MQVQSERELEETLLPLVTDPVRRARLGAAARALVEANRGAKDKTLAVIADSPRRRRRSPSARSVAALPAGALIPRPSSSVVQRGGRRGGGGGTRAIPSRRRRLSQPVVSVGNLRVGGSGKTPIVAHIARLLLERGERPAILTRGYARRCRPDGVTVVSDGTTILAGIESAGDEPLMLARALPGVPVLVGANRYLSGRLAEERFGATVHLLDDGFQHLELARDVDLLLVSRRRS